MFKDEKIQSLKEPHTREQATMRARCESLLIRSAITAFALREKLIGAIRWARGKAGKKRGLKVEERREDGSYGVERSGQEEAAKEKRTARGVGSQS